MSGGQVINVVPASNVRLDLGTERGGEEGNEVDARLFGESKGEGFERLHG